MPRNTGAIPPHDLVDFKFRNGKESKQPYTAKQMQWGHHRKGMDDDWDIVAVKPV